MAQATITLTVSGYPNGVDNTQRHEILFGVAAILAGGTYVTNGIPFVWAFQAAEGGAFIPNFNNMVPVWADFKTLAGSNQTYEWDTVHQTLRVYIAGVEVTNGTAITADTVGFRAEFNKGF
jgi:hypothetical protein